MGWQDKVIKGGEQVILQPRILIYSPPGVGKSTFASKLPKPIFIDLDKGIDELRVDRIPGPATWEETLSLIRELAADPGPYKSLVLDTVDPLEELAVDHVLRQAHKESLSDFSFGAGYSAVGQEWRLLLAELDIARKHGMLVALLSHAIIRQAQDAVIGAFDQYTSALGKRSWQLTSRWVDLVGFASFESALIEKKGDNARVIVTGDRFLHTTRGSGFEAKNRYSLPVKLPLAWSAVEAGIARHRQSADAVKEKILKLATGTALEAKAKSYLLQAGDDLNMLIEIEDQLVKAIQNPLPAVIPASATATAPVAAQQESGAAEVARRVELLARGTPFEEKAAGYLREANGNVPMLLEIEKVLVSRLSEMKQAAATAPETAS